MIKFLKKLFTKWIVIIGLIPALYDRISVYLSWEFSFPTWVVILFAIGALFYASYQVYESEYKKRMELEEKLKGPTNYEIQAILSPIDFEENRFLKKLENIKKEIDEKLNSLPSPIHIHTGNQLESLTQTIDSVLKRQDKTSEQYNNELNRYKKELILISESIPKYKKDIHDTISSLKQKYYFVKFLIKNTGTISDSNIQATITCNDNNIIFQKNEMLKYGINLVELLPVVPKKPEKPKLNIYGFNTLESHNSYLPHFENLHLDIQDPNAYRKKVEIEDQKCFVLLKDLHVGGEADLFNIDLIILNEAEIKFEATVRSKESTRTLCPDVVIVEEKMPKTLYPQKG